MRQIGTGQDNRSPRGAAAALAVALCLGALCTEARAADPVKDFLDAMLRNDEITMRALVRLHRRDMVVAFYSMIRETGSLLGVAADDEAARKAAVLLAVSSRLAETFDAAYPGQDLLRNQFAGSEPLLTPTARAGVQSDATFAGFLSTCKVRALDPMQRSVAAADLKSIFDAAAESPEDQAKRLLEERLAQLRREQAAREEQERLARYRGKVAVLKVTADVEGLLQLVDDGATEPKLRALAVEALAALRDPEAIGGLAKHAGEEALRGATIGAIATIGGDRAAQALAGMLGDPATSSQAADALRRVWGDRAAEGFLRILRDGGLGAAHGRAAIAALGRLHAAEAVDELIRRADDPELGGAAVEALGQIGGERAAAALVAKLDDAALGEKAKEALCGLGETAVPPLRDRLAGMGGGAGLARAADALARLDYEPGTLSERARLLLARGRTGRLILLGPFAVPAALEGLRVGSWAVRGTSLAVLAFNAVGAAAVVFAIILALWWRWVFPDATVRLAAGQSRQVANQVRQRPEDLGAESGSILKTLWARTRLRRRQRIKVETFLGEDGPSALAALEQRGASLNEELQRCRDLGFIFNSREREQQLLKQLKGLAKERKSLARVKPCDVLVSVGASVPKGTYLATGDGVSVKVKVSR